MAGFRHEGNTSGNVDEVDSDHNALVNLPKILTQAGFGAVAARVDDGTITGTPKYQRGWISESGRLLIGQSTILWDDTFNATAQNTSKYKFAATTQTVADAAGILTLNNSGITTINTNSGIQTWRTFPLLTNSELRFILSGGFSAANDHVANGITEFGLFSADLTTRVAPTDGVFWRYNAANELRGVVSFGGVETQTSALSKPATNAFHDWMIVVQANVVTFWIDSVLRGTITLLTDAPTQGQPFLQGAQPITIREYIGGSAPASAIKLQVTDVIITLVGPDTDKPWAESKAGTGHMAYQGQNGGTMGTTAQYANSTNPAATVPTNTTAALGTGLGGKFFETLTLAAGTDGIICSFQNPVGSINQTPRTLIIKGVTISGVVGVALTVAPLAGTMSLAFGHTAVSLATAEGTSFTTSPTTKAPRRIALCATGLSLVTSPVGTLVAGLPFVAKFECPVVVAPGEFVAITHCKLTGGVPTTGAVMWTITFDAYFE